MTLTLVATDSVTVSGTPKVTFGVRPLCTDLFEFAQKTSDSPQACDVPRNVLLPATQLQAFFDNPGGGDPVNASLFDNTLLEVSHFSPGSGDVKGLSWPLRIDLGDTAPLDAGPYELTITWTGDEVNGLSGIPTTGEPFNVPLREVLLLDGTDKLFDFRTGQALAASGVTCTGDGGVNSCTIDITGPALKTFTILVSEVIPPPRSER